MEVYQYQNNGILKEFKGLSAVAIQEKCKNLEFSCQFLESDKDSFVVINAVNSIFEAKNKFKMGNPGKIIVACVKVLG